MNLNRTEEIQRIKKISNNLSLVPSEIKRKNKITSMKAKQDTLRRKVVTEDKIERLEIKNIIAEI